ncbi:MAG: hypothetical protein O3A95_07805 [Planctomycetota bacterium]|nr:hypothetical protein [Planctomycetota bacterium]MDA1114186.1 hypothetical protein [Planctomycetota bacterium]
MIGLLTALVLASVQQTPSLPFQFDLPQGYSAFEESAEGPGSWVSTRKDEGASFRVRHYAVTPGAIPAAVAKDIRDRMWAPRLHGIEHGFEAWAGKVDGIEAAGWIISYQADRSSMTILERIAIQGEAMTMVVWEGPSAGQEAASKILDDFTVPEAWLSMPAPEYDIYRGLGPSANAPMFPGGLEIDVFLHSFAVDEFFTVRITYIPGLAPITTQDLSWVIPEGASVQEQVDDLGGRRIVYRIPMDQASGLGGSYGITRLEGQEFSALNPLWLALPSPAASMRNVQAPAWKMTITHLANLEAISTSVTRKDFDEANKATITEFDGLQAGVAWPFFLIGDYELHQTSNQNWHLRLDSKATLPEDAMLEVMRLRKVLDEWLPRNHSHWNLASFAYIGDRVMPGLIVLDEQRNWFTSPVDGTLDGLSRRTALARLLCQEPFGARLHGRGSAALFLEASLAEYATWRLLEAAGNQADADALQKQWRSSESQAGKLPQPLSMLESGDLYGPRRLLSFGPLVWQAIEKQCGREAFDAILREKMAEGFSWSTQDLEVALKAINPKIDWDAFFLKHVYGRHLPGAE